MRDSRALTSGDHDRLEAVLGRFRAEFDCWRDLTDNEWDLLAFVLYEGVTPPVVAEATPLILGKKCVALHGARWCMIRSGDEWHFGIDHNDLAEPVDLTNFKPKALRRRLSDKWQRLLDPFKPAR